MPMYRKTALVEAHQFLPPHQIPEGCYQKGTIGDVASGHGEWYLKTLEAEHPLRTADYVCIGVQGERWNVERSIFEATYEVASDQQPSLTKKQAAIIGAFTGFAIGPFSDIQEYAERVLGRPIWTHEFADKATSEKLREAARADFVALAYVEQPS